MSVSGVVGRGRGEGPQGGGWGGSTGAGEGSSERVHGDGDGEGCKASIRDAKGAVGAGSLEGRRSGSPHRAGRLGFCVTTHSKEMEINVFL